MPGFFVYKCPHGTHISFKHECADCAKAEIKRLKTILEESRNIRSSELIGDFEVRIMFASCRAASTFRRAIGEYIKEALRS